MENAIQRRPGLPVKSPALAVDCPSCGAMAGFVCGTAALTNPAVCRDVAATCRDRGRLSRWLSKEGEFTDTEHYFRIHVTD